MTRATSNARWRLATSVMVALAGGCGASVNRPASQAGVVDYNHGSYAAACQQLKPLAKQTDEDYALNNVRLGSADLAAGRVDDARSAFQTAYELMNATQVDNGGRAAVAVTVDSSARIWKGEPFERAMANYYLGLTYYVDHDYNNARGAFENALFKLHDYNPDADDGSGMGSPAAGEANAAQESNFAAAYLMLGRCHTMLGETDAATADFTRAVRYQPSLARTVARAASPGTNLVLFVDVGRGPARQYAYHSRGPDGPGSPEFLGFGPVPQGQPRVAVSVAVDGVPQSPGDAAPAVDLLALAQQRRWDALNTVHDIKKALEGAAVLASAFTPYALLGVFALKASDQTDTREWGMLPRTVVVLPLSLTPGHHHIDVADPTDGAPASVEVDVPAHGDAAAYAKLLPPADPQRVLYASDAPPPPDGGDPGNTWYEVRVENRSASPAVLQFDGVAGGMVIPPFGSNFAYMPAGQRQVAARLVSADGSNYRRVAGSYAVGPQRWLVVGDDGVETAKPDPGQGIGYPPRRVRSDAPTPAGRAMAQRMGKLGVGPQAALAGHRQGKSGGSGEAVNAGGRKRQRAQQEQAQAAEARARPAAAPAGNANAKKQH